MKAGGSPSVHGLSRLAAFAALAGVAALQWASLLAEPAEWRFALCVLIAVVAASGLLTLSGAPARVRVGGTIAIGALATIAGLIAIGIPAGQLLPWGWDSLAYSIDDGIGRLRGSLEYPLADRGGLSSALLTATLPLLLGLAALLAFLPDRRSDPAIASLAILLGLFAVPATARATEAPLAWGAVLLALVCVWLWAPRIRAPAAVVLLGCVAAVAIPAASSLAQRDPLVDYRSWGLSAPPSGIDFGWDHGYGPIDWSRTGTPLFEVRSDEPRYWRASILDEFYAFGWRRSADGGAPVPAPGPVAVDGRWDTDASFTVRSLESRLLISPGIAVGIDGVEGVQADPDGTLNSDAEPLEEGVEYSITAYAPEPGARRMRVASQRYPRELEPYTRVAIPFVPAPLGTSQAIEPLTPATFQVPLWGSPRASAGSGTVAGIADSPYGRTAQLARRLTAGQQSAYDAVLAVQEHLRQSYAYDESPPDRQLPIPAFLFRDRIGYCQQFSGAMALMLRMSGIPARVASGFSPGTPVSGREGTYEVTDLDAHSWVEVYFDRVGWVPFDPTPSAAPAESQSDGSGAGSAAPEGGGSASFKDLGAGFRGDDEPVPTRAVDAGGTPWVLVILLGALATAALGTAVAGGRAFAFRRLPADSAAEAELAELAPALRASGRSAASSMTLLELERRLRDGGRRAAAAYVAALREIRFCGAGAAPTLAQRRALRRDLAERGGLLRRLRLLVAMPPGAPRRGRGQSVDR